MSQHKRPNPFLKYGNMAFQMAGIIGLSVYGGQKLDKYFDNKTPVYTIVFSLLGIFVAMYLVLRDLINPKNGSN